MAAERVSLTTSEVESLGRIAREVAVEAGRLAMLGRPGDLQASATKSSPTDVVTVMDTRTEELLRTRLLAMRPQDGILGEEGDDHDGTSGVTWVLDPIDGTVNYLYGILAYAVSVAAAVGDPHVAGEWEVVAAAVADPAHGTCHHAVSGGGAWVTDATGATRELRVGAERQLSSALVGTGFGYTAARRQEQATLLLDVLPMVRDIRRIGSAALDLCMVADGRLDAFYEVGLNPWDLAGGWLVVTEAGGVVSGPGGGAPSHLLTVAANPALHPTLAALVDRADRTA